MVGQHPQLLGLPELKLFACATLGELAATLPPFWIARGVLHRSPGLIRAVAQLIFGDQSVTSMQQALAWMLERNHWSGAEVLDGLMERALPRCCVEKSPENVESDAALARLAAAYPRARYLHLTRHPVATQRSIEAHLERMLPGRGAIDQPMSGIAAWYVAHSRILRLAAALSPDRYLRVKAEDVLNDPLPQLGAIAAWLGLGVDACSIDAMTHAERSPFATPAPTGDDLPAGNDPAFLRDPRPRSVEVPGAVVMPEGWAESQQAWQFVVELAAALGYS